MWFGTCIPMLSHRNTQFLNYITYLLVNYYKHNSLVQQYIDKPLARPIEKYFDGLATDVVPGTDLD